MSHSGWTCGCGRHNKRSRKHCADCGRHRHDRDNGVRHSAKDSKDPATRVSSNKKK